jgi:hypothetical protein
MSGKLDVGLEVYDAVSNALIISGLTRDTAKKYAYFAEELYQYIKDSPELKTVLEGAKSTYDMAKGAKGYAAAARLSSNATTMNALSSAESFAARGTFSAGGAISAFVNYFAAIAKSLHIEMNECTIAVTKVMLDVLTTIALADTVIGLWAAALQVLATGADATEMVQACFQPEAANAR